MVGQEFPAFPSHLKSRRSPQVRREEHKGCATIPRVPQMSQSIPGKPVFPALPRLSSRGSLTPRWHVGQPCGKASWESLKGKPQGKATEPLIHAKGSATLLLQLGRKVHLHAPLETRTDSPRETPEYPKIHVSTGEESSGSGTDSTRGLRPQHRRERNPKSPPSNSHGEWPLLRPPEWVPEVPVESREHLPQLENIQEVLPSRRDECHFR